jgi:hypothetical protein
MAIIFYSVGSLFLGFSFLNSFELSPIINLQCFIAASILIVIGSIINTFFQFKPS